MLKYKKTITLFVVLVLLSSSTVMTFASSDYDYYLVESYSSNSKADNLSVAALAGLLSQLTGLSAKKFNATAATVYFWLDAAGPTEVIYYDVDKYMAITYGGTGGYDIYHMKYVTTFTDSKGNAIADPEEVTFDSIAPMLMNN